MGVSSTAGSAIVQEAVTLQYKNQQLLLREQQNNAEQKD
jgi:hypothetical protein